MEVQSPAEWMGRNYLEKTTISNNCLYKKVLPVNLNNLGNLRDHKHTIFSFWCLTTSHCTVQSVPLSLCAGQARPGVQAGSGQHSQVSKLLARRLSEVCKADQKPDGFWREQQAGSDVLQHTHKMTKKNKQKNNRNVQKVYQASNEFISKMLNEFSLFFSTRTQTWAMYKSL